MDSLSFQNSPVLKDFFDTRFVIEGVDYLKSDGSLQKNQSIVIEKNRFAQIQPEGSLPKDLRSIRADGFVMLPGFINLHTHSAMSYLRGFHPPNPDVIANVFFKTEKQLTPALVENLSYNYIFESLISGTTTINDHYYFSVAVARACQALGSRGFIGDTIIDDGGPFDTLKGIEKNIHEIFALNNRQIRPIVAPHATDTILPETWDTIKKIQKKHQLKLHFHLSQRRGEYEAVKNREGLSPVKFCQKIGVLNQDSIAVHLIYLDPGEEQVLDESGVHMVLCPASQILFDKVSPLLKNLEHFDHINIATDCAASNDSADLLAELRLTASLFKMQTGRILPPKKLLDMITLNPARALGIDHELGSIKEGKIADFSLLKKTPMTQPLDRLLDHLVYSNCSKDITHVFVDGKPVLLHREPVNIGMNTLMEKFDEAYSQIKFPFGNSPGA